MAGLLAFPAFGQWSSYSANESYAGFENVQTGGYTPDTLDESARLYFNFLDWDYCSKY